MACITTTPPPLLHLLHLLLLLHRCKTTKNAALRSGTNTPSLHLCCTMPPKLPKPDHPPVRALGEAAVSDALLRECARGALALFTESEPQSFSCCAGSKEAPEAQMTSHALRFFASSGFAWPPMSNRKERLAALVKSLFR